MALAYGPHGPSAFFRNLVFLVSCYKLCDKDDDETWKIYFSLSVFLIFFFHFGNVAVSICKTSPLSPLWLSSPSDHQKRVRSRFMWLVFWNRRFLAFTVTRVIARPKRRRLSRPWLVVVVVMWNRRILSTFADPDRPVRT